MQPLISIITPFKNTGSYLFECLDSVLEQTYQNWEMLLIDDHSSDNSAQIVAGYSKINSRVKLTKNNGVGIIEALRTGYSQSAGNFITRMDSDDIMAPEKLDTLISGLLESGKRHLATGRVKYFRKDGLSNGYIQYQNWLNRLTSDGSNYSEIYRECVIPSPCWMVYREDLEKCGAFNPDRYPEDYDLAFRFYKRGLKVIPCTQILHYWRDYSTRTSRTDEHYAANYFLDIKLHWFLQLDYNPDSPLVVWGAGSKGKEIARKLIEGETPFQWVCNNPNKIGHKIYGKEMLPFDSITNLVDPQIIVTVANKDAQRNIRTFFHKQGMKPMTDYFFFC